MVWKYLSLLTAEGRRRARELKEVDALLKASNEDIKGIGTFLRKLELSIKLAEEKRQALIELCRADLRTIGEAFRMLRISEGEFKEGLMLKEEEVKKRVERTAGRMLSGTHQLEIETGKAIQDPTTIVKLKELEMNEKKELVRLKELLARESGTIPHLLSGVAGIREVLEEGVQDCEGIKIRLEAEKEHNKMLLRLVDTTIEETTKSFKAL